MCVRARVGMKQTPCIRSFLLLFSLSQNKAEGLPQKCVGAVHEERRERGCLSESGPSLWREAQDEGLVVCSRGGETEDNDKPISSGAVGRLGRVGEIDK